MFCLASSVLLAASADASGDGIPNKEVRMDRMSRPAPPNIKPIVIDGIRYEQVLSPRKLGLTEPGGWLMATDAKTGERKWTQQIYKTTINPADETDVQEIYFASMARIKGQRALTIRNEAGKTYTIDLDTRQVSEAR